MKISIGFINVRETWLGLEHWAGALYETKEEDQKHNDEGWQVAEVFIEKKDT